MLLRPSFTHSERFLQTDQLITRLQVVVMTNFIRMLMRDVIVNVIKSDAVIWWAAIFRTPPSSPTVVLSVSGGSTFESSVCISSHLASKDSVVSDFCSLLWEKRQEVLDLHVSFECVLISRAGLVS